MPLFGVLLGDAVNMRREQAGSDSVNYAESQQDIARGDRARGSLFRLASPGGYSSFPNQFPILK